MLNVSPRVHWSLSTIETLRVRAGGAACGQLKNFDGSGTQLATFTIIALFSRLASQQTALADSRLGIWYPQP